MRRSLFAATVALALIPGPSLGAPGDPPPVRIGSTEVKGDAVVVTNGAVTLSVDRGSVGPGDRLTYTIELAHPDGRFSDVDLVLPRDVTLDEPGPGCAASEAGATCGGLATASVPLQFTVVAEVEADACEHEHSDRQLEATAVASDGLDVFDAESVVTTLNCAPGHVACSDGSSATVQDISDSSGTNVHEGRSRSRVRQRGEATSGDAIAGQVTGFVVRGDATITSRNVTRHVSARSGDVSSSNDAVGCTGAVATTPP